jgi:hypothetical protein
MALDSRADFRFGCPHTFQDLERYVRRLAKPTRQDVAPDQGEAPGLQLDIVTPTAC